MEPASCIVPPSDDERRGPHIGRRRAPRGTVPASDAVRPVLRAEPHGAPRQPRASPRYSAKGLPNAETIGMARVTRRARIGEPRMCNLLRRPWRAVHEAAWKARAAGCDQEAEKIRRAEWELMLSWPVAGYRFTAASVGCVTDSFDSRLRRPHLPLEILGHQRSLARQPRPVPQHGELQPRHIRAQDRTRQTAPWLTCRHSSG